MKIQYETVLAGPGRSFAAYETVGPAVDCEYHVHPELELVYVVSGYGSRFGRAGLGFFALGKFAVKVTHQIDKSHYQQKNRHYRAHRNEAEQQGLSYSHRFDRS